MNTIRFLSFAAGLFTANLVNASNEVPGKPQQTPVAIVGATIHPVTGPAIENGTIVFDQGKIKAIGKDLPVDAAIKTIDASGKHVYPSLFDAYTNVGLVEINSISATMDNREGGSLNPNVKSWVAVNPDSELIPVTRANGVLLTLTAPSGSLIAGRSAVLQLDGWSTEDLVLKADIGLHVNWPASFGFADSEGEGGGPGGGGFRSGGSQALKDFFEQARVYHAARNAQGDAQAIDLRLEAMRPVLDRQLPLIVNAEDAREIQGAVAFAIEQNVRLMIHGGYDAEACADLLKQHQVPVIVSGTYRLPQRADDAYDAPYTLPARLHAAGVKYCLASVGKFGASGVRNLPYHAATAVAYGLSKDEALKAITLYPADILGVADRVGSLEVGKDATLFISTGDPLETSTQVVAAYVQGRDVELNDKHKRLYRKYEAKYSK